MDKHKGKDRDRKKLMAGSRVFFFCLTEVMASNWNRISFQMEQKPIIQKISA